MNTIASASRRFFSERVARAAAFFKPRVARAAAFFLTCARTARRAPGPKRPFATALSAAGAPPSSGGTARACTSGRTRRGSCATSSAESSMKRPPARTPARGPSREIESRLRAQGKRRIAGVDEAGRGALAGPLVVGACVLPERAELPRGLRDSKKLSGKQRDAVMRALRGIPGIELRVAVVPPEEVDRSNVLAATLAAMTRAADELEGGPADAVLVDGNVVPEGLRARAEALVKGDDREMCIAAASVLAKTTRDAIMRDEVHRLYPTWGFDRHVGYGTEQHRKMIERHGPLDVHRKSFEPAKSWTPLETLKT